MATGQPLALNAAARAGDDCVRNAQSGVWRRKLPVEALVLLEQVLGLLPETLTIEISTGWVVVLALVWLIVRARM